MTHLLEHLLPFVIPFALACVLTLILTPLVRELNRRLGMVDKPDPRRINIVPIPRGGGVALYLGLFSAYWIYALYLAQDSGQVAMASHPVRLFVLSTSIFLLGLADDKFGMNPKVKLLGQLVVAFFAWWWGGLGFRVLWPSLPLAVDCALTVFWIVGAINAFNLIDGLDGLASGIALIATLGMTGSIIFAGRTSALVFHFAFVGALVGFLRYNYHPASVFLGDSGSMLIGFIVSVMPLAAQTPNSFVVSVGVPLLAMGVPIFDTSLAILRRSLRHLLRRRENRELEAGNSDQVMAADHDHLHHRILRSAGFNQRKAAWILYGMAFTAVMFGIFGQILSSRSAGVWLLAVAVAAIVIFRDMASIELFDAGRLLSTMAHERAWEIRRRHARLAMPFALALDFGAVVLAFLIAVWSLRIPIDRELLRINFLIRIFVTFLSLFGFRVYMTVWGRATIANYMRLLLACACGAVLSSVLIYYLPMVDPTSGFVPATLMYFAFSFIFLGLLRFLRPLVRDLFYLIDCSRLKGRKDVSRILVYGAGLRFRSFRSELVRRASVNNRIIVGLLDDDLLLRGKLVGSLRVLGTLREAPEIINRLNVDAVVIACEVTDRERELVCKMLAPTGVKVTHFNFVEKEIGYGV